MMKPVTALLLAFSLAGCATWHRPDTTKLVTEQALAHCETQANARFPPKIVREQVTFGHLQPGTEQCWHQHHYLFCQHYPAQWIPPQFVQRNVNSEPRQAWIIACMKGQGFTR